MQLGIIGVVVLLLLGGGVYYMQNNASGVDKEAMEQKAMMEKEAMLKAEMTKEEEGVMEKDEVMKKGDVMMKDEDVMKKKDSMMKGDDAMIKKDEMMVIKGSIQTYSPEKLVLAEKGKVLLFFHASWCPICRQLDAEAVANPNIVPDGITILKVDYDTATALKQKYGVTVQHTFVQVDSAGMLIKKFSDASNYKTVFGKVQ